jgi:hypothetical protein
MQAIKLFVRITATGVMIAGCAEVLDLDKPFEVEDKLEATGDNGGAGGTGGSSQNIVPCFPDTACYPGPGATVNVGVCKFGVLTCINGMPGPCEGAILPSAEICNGLDDDCDGVVDNSDVLNGQYCETAYPGICKTGTTSCIDGSLVCEAKITPGGLVEVCDDQVDNDCNGQVDGCNCEPHAQMDCAYCTDPCLFASDDLDPTPVATPLGISRKDGIMLIPPPLEVLCCASQPGIQICLPDGSAWGPCNPI